MNRASMFVVAGVLGLPLVGASVVLASPAAKAAEAKTAEGTVKSADAKAMSFVLTGADKKDITIKVTKDTKYTLDGKDSTMEAALKAGNTAKVTHTDMTASKVAAMSPAKK